VEQTGSVLLVGEDDAFEMYGEFLCAHGLTATVRRSPADAMLAIATTRPDVVVTELVFRAQIRVVGQLVQHEVSNVSARSPLRPEKTPDVASIAIGATPRGARLRYPTDTS
jgi:hypothetical protein